MAYSSSQLRSLIQGPRPRGRAGNPGIPSNPGTPGNPDIPGNHGNP